MKKSTYHINWVHCASCKIFIEDTLREQNITGNVDIKKGILHCNCADLAETEKQLKNIEPILQKHWYSLSKKKITPQKDDLVWTAIPLGLGILILFILLQKSGILKFSVDGNITTTTSFILGIFASLSSCLAVVWGLILSLSAQLGTQGKQWKISIILFHWARILGFAILWWLLWILGNTLKINTFFSGILWIIASLVMIIVWLDLVGFFKNTLSFIPSNLFTFFRGKGGTYLMPILVGIGTFFLPCGFTQSMQVAALSSGSFIGGLSIMIFFALGTFPMLAILSFGSYSFSESSSAPLFFKTIGIVVIGFGLITLLTGIIGLGIVPPFINI